MMAAIDIDRITICKYKIERLINNSVRACKNSSEDWAKNFWHGVFVKLCKKYNREDLYNKNLH